MVKFYESLSDDLRDWALNQQLFFIATAPMNGKHVNLSPKGLPCDTLHFRDPNHVQYLDLTGSGAETISHVYENGRATLMFCSFDQSPRIMRFFCTGKVIEYTHPDFQNLLPNFGKGDTPGARSIILLDIWKVQTSCGFAVPQFSKDIPKSADSENDPPLIELSNRYTLNNFATKTDAAGQLEAYRGRNNARSLDGLPGLTVARRYNGEKIWLDGGKALYRRFMAQTEGVILGFVLALFSVFLYSHLRITAGTVVLA